MGENGLGVVELSLREGADVESRIKRLDFLFPFLLFCL